MSAKKVVLLSGDGVGPEISAACLKIIEASGAQIDWERAAAGSESLRQGKEVIPPETLNAIAKHGVAYKGPLATPVGTGHASANVMLRKHFKLFANVRPVKSFAGFKGRFENVDLVIFRENTEDLYSGIEHVVCPGVVESIKVITAEASERIARFTFEYCRIHGRKRVTVGHKANIMKLSDGLFLESVRKVHQEFSDIAIDEMIIDNLCHNLVLKPEKFDVILTQNLYGDIVSDLCAGLVGGLGLVPGANIGKDCAIFEAVHGTAPDIAGKGIANPTAMLMSGCLMLEHLGFPRQAESIRRSVETLMSQHYEKLTQDLGGKATTVEFTDAVIAEINRNKKVLIKNG